MKKPTSIVYQHPVSYKSVSDKIISTNSDNGIYTVDRIKHQSTEPLTVHESQVIKFEYK